MLTRTTPAIKNNTGPAENLFIDDIPKPAPAAGEALIKVKAFGLNRMDLLQREGKYPVPPQAPPTMGVEFSGVIEGFGDGSNVGDFKVGGEVLGLAYGGAYAEYVVVALAMLVHKPKELSWEEAAGVPEVSIGYAAEDRAIADVYVYGRHGLPPRKHFSSLAISNLANPSSGTPVPLPSRYRASNSPKPTAQKPSTRRPVRRRRSIS